MAAYKTIPLSDHNNRTTRDVPADELTKARATVTEFITYFKAKHL